MANSNDIPKSRLTLTYRTTVRGEPEDVQLPLRIAIFGDLSAGTSKDRKVDLDQRTLRNLDGKNLDRVLADMNMTLRFSAPNRVDPERAESLEVELPITSMKSFSPREIAKNVPKLRALLLMRQLLLELQGNMDNRKEFRKLVRQLAQDDGALEALREQFKSYDAFKLPVANPPAGSDAGPQN